MATVAPELPVLARDQAFEILYRRYVKDVYHYALALLRNPADAEDVTQTTFMNAYRAYKRGERIEKPQNWLIKIAHNVARTRYARSKRRVKEVPLEEHLDQLALPEEERPNVEGVLRALGRLPFNQRAAIVMRELEGRSYAEIADVLAVSVPAVETLIFRARRSLRLRASALRALGVVPLPTSLASLLEGGGVVAAGGGAVAGTGFVVKAAVALVAGAVATGIGGSKTSPTAAAKPEARAKAEPGIQRQIERRATVGATRVRGGARNAVRAHAAVRRAGGALALGSAESLRAAVKPSGSTASTGSTGSTGSSAPATATEETTTTVTNAVTTVTAALPVDLPPAPALPVVELPPPPVSLP